MLIAHKLPCLANCINHPVVVLVFRVMKLPRRCRRLVVVGSLDRYLPSCRRPLHNDRGLVTWRPPRPGGHYRPGCWSVRRPAPVRGSEVPDKVSAH